MKYQGFYDYSLDDSGNPDRTFTAKQFCMYLKGLLGNGIGITNATGDNAWKLEKTGELTAKITLGNNGYNFASLDGNPFIIDEELEFTFSQGADRWDAILIRANSTLEVRATDVVIQENDISYTRSTDIYDLRIARVHIVDNIITEIIDDRLNNEYCGIADGLTTVPTSELEQLLEDVKSGNLVALKDGNLQTNLNAEMIEGKKTVDLLPIYGSYTGDGNSIINIFSSLGFIPKMIQIIERGNSNLDYCGTIVTNGQNLGSGYCQRLDCNNGKYFELNFTEQGIIIGSTNTSASALNSKSSVYDYIMFR